MFRCSLIAIKRWGNYIKRRQSVSGAFFVLKKQFVYTEIGYVAKRLKGVDIYENKKQPL